MQRLWVERDWAPRYGDRTIPKTPYYGVASIWTGPYRFVGIGAVIAATGVAGTLAYRDFFARTRDRRLEVRGARYSQLAEAVERELSRRRGEKPQTAHGH